MAIESNNVGVIESGKVENLTIVTQAPVMPPSASIPVAVGEKPEKFIGLNFK